MSWIDQRPDDAMDGAFTAVGPEPVRTVEPGAFREAMSRLGAAVHVITTAGPGGKAGATATAVCSVSDAPPTLLMCLNRRSQTNPVVVENGVFCVNTLGDGGAEIADIFAGRTGVQRQRSLCHRRVADAGDRQPGARVRGDRVRLPHHRGAVGREPQRVLRRGRSGAARSGRPGARLSRTRLQAGVSRSRADEFGKISRVRASTRCACNFRAMDFRDATSGRVP